MNNVPNIVVASNRPGLMSDFLQDWSAEFSGCNVIVVWDLPSKPLTAFDYSGWKFSIQEYSWSEIDDEIKDNSWIIPRKSSAIKSFGFLKALQNHPLFIVALDDDTKPSKPGHIMKFYNILFQNDKRDISPNPHWISTCKSILPRGTYNEFRDIMLVHGGWINTPDYDTKSQILNYSDNSFSESDFNEMIIPSGVFFSMCGMNIAFKPEIIKYLYFGLQGESKDGIPYPTSRMDDILCGIYVKYHLDKVFKSVYSGEPFVVHDRASNVWNNLVKDRNNEVVLNDFMKYLVEGVDKDNSYIVSLDSAYKIWGELCASYSKV